MTSSSRPLLGLALAAFLLLLAPLRAAFDPLTAAPKNAELVAGLNARVVLGSPLWDTLWKESETPQMRAGLSILQSLTGVDFLKDIDGVWIVGRVNDPDSVGVFFEGRFQEEKLTVLLQANKTYKKYEVSGHTVHEWLDDKENRTKYGAFLPGGVVAIWNSRGAMEASLAALADRTKSLAGTEDARVVPAEAEKAAAWAILITRQATCPGAKLRIANASAFLAFEQESVAMTMTVRAESPEAETQWLDMAKGALALARLQKENEELTRLANDVRVEQAPDGSVRMFVRVPQSALIEGARKRMAERDATR